MKRRKITPLKRALEAYGESAASILLAAWVHKKGRLKDRLGKMKRVRE